MYCGQCGLKVEAGAAKYCCRCGSALPAVNPPPPANPGSKLRDIADALRKSGALRDGGLLRTNQPPAPLTKAEKRSAITPVVILMLLAAGMFIGNSRM